MEEEEVNEQKFILQEITKPTIKQLLIAIKNWDCPVDRCSKCLIDVLIKCNEDNLLLDQIGPAAKEVLKKVPQDRLFDIVL